MAAYQRSLVAADAPFDRWRNGESWRRGLDAPGMSAAAQEGFELFTNKAGCALCHTVEDKYANFTDNGFHVIGARRRFGLPTQASDDPDDDLGRFKFSGKAVDRRAFKTPSLRNITRTPPYMHDGSLATLAEVIDFYDRGGGNLVGKSPMLRKLNLDEQEKAALIAFLESLNSPHWDKLVSDARSPVRKD